ncbi:MULTISPECIES: serpin family protein [unclassified Streptomyces]|uniref:serpin family protein n=1 Tax=unclassified Streptomyces TaxID=2593676 RepID=UPI002473082D|nr:MULTISPECIES: serpin family protein [unclassified Streptomyces]MDH6452633.1 serine protease inhibitor [Streptomyces sp. SAI-119]MDH6496813.1 serine protease inhibitor [Streptomyces sp. SAI-149]
MPITGATAQVVNGLTARWAGVSSGGTVFSAAGVWPLLAFLADGAQGAARAELARALGVPAEQAAAAARELLAGLADERALDCALGLWTRRTLELREEWETGLPVDALGVLTGDPALDQREMDAWAAKRTGGLIERMPVEARDDTELVLASALALRTTWLRPFEVRPVRPSAGPWQGRTLRGLHRLSVRLDRVGVAAAPEGRVTEVRVLGDHGIDVHLLLGDEHMTPGQVMAAGTAALDGTCPVVRGSLLPYGPAGPGLRVEERPCATPRQPTLEVTTAAFEVRAHHDLLELHGLFGLTAARDARQGHFPGISVSPLTVGSARQSVLARFDALGFEAAAVTAVAAAPGAAPGGAPLGYTSTVVTAAFDRPFGFLAVHRETRLALTAGWVKEPAAFG